MNTDNDFYLMQLSDSLFPSGMFSMSSGFEAWSKFHRIKSASGVKDFITQQLRCQIIPLDCPIFRDTILSASKHELEKIINNDMLYFSTKLVKEVRTASVRSGIQIIACLRNMIENLDEGSVLCKFQDEIKNGKARGTHVVALALAMNCLNISLDKATRLFLYTFCTNIISAAIRLGIIGHMEGQKLLFELSFEINERIQTLESNNIDDIWQLTPITEILQMKHEQDESKMFIT